MSALAGASRRLALAWVIASVATLGVLTGCASPPKPAPDADPVTGPWAGRMALTVEDQPGQSFSAGFELRGAAGTGELTLYSPLGGTLGVLDWQPGRATLRANGQVTEFASVDALLAQATGTALPVAALFDWLGGKATPVAGWQPDLSQAAAGRIAARRVDPPPRADLRVVLER